MLHTLLNIVPLTASEVVPYIPSPPAVASSAARDNCMPTLYESLISVNLTRSANGDEFTRDCGLDCEKLCRSAGAVRLRCNVEETPRCRCKCPRDETIRPDSLICAPFLKVNDSNTAGCHPPIFHFDVSSVENYVSSNTSYSRIDNRRETQAELSTRQTASQAPLQCRLLGVHSTQEDAKEIPNVSQSFRITRTEGTGFDVTLMGVTHDLQRLHGQLLKLNVSCEGDDSSFCIAVKLSGSIAHSTNFHSPHLPSAMTYDDDITTQEIGTMTSAGTTKSAEEEQLEHIISGLCISVAVLMTVWLTCFLVEKKVQRKHSRTVTISTPTSSSKTYTYEVSSVRKTLMEMFDMPMIKIHSSDENSNRPSSLSSDKSETNEPEETCKSDSEDFNGSTDVFGPEPSGYSTSSSDDLKEPSSSKAILLDVPEHKVTDKLLSAHDDFAHWIPMARAQAQSDSKDSIGSPHDSPAKKDLVNFSPKHSPKKGKHGGKKHNEYNSPSKPKKEIKLHPPILKSAMKSPHRKKYAAVRVAMEDEIVFTRPSRSNNNYLEMNSNVKAAGNNEQVSPRESPNLSQVCTKL